MTVRMGSSETHRDSTQHVSWPACSCLVAIVGAMMLAMSASACSTTGEAGPTATMPSPRESQKPPFYVSPDDGEVRVVEKGFSVIDGDPKPMISYGIVLENTSKFVAHRVHVTVGLLDATGNPVQLRDPADHDDPLRTLKIFEGSDYILPGERSPIGGSYHIYRGGTVRDVASLEVTVRDTDEWWPVKDWVARVKYCPVRTSNVKTHRGQWFRISFDIIGAVPGCDVVDDGVFQGYSALVLYRNKHGRVVGSMRDSLVTRVSQESDPTLRGRIGSWTARPSKDQVDDSQTKVYLDWDPVP